jgi:tetratricopeptide (TPR) repeat protein
MKNESPLLLASTDVPALADDPTRADGSGIVLLSSDEGGLSTLDEVEGESSINTEDDDEDHSAKDLLGPAWQGFVFALLPVLICLFGAGRETWSKGVGACVLGITMLVFPVRRRLPQLVELTLLAIVLVPLLAFVPEYWIQESPAWRTRLAQDWGIEMSRSLTPQAAVTFEMWLTLILFVSWLWWCLSRGFSKKQRRVMIQVLAAGGVMLCLFSILEKSGWLPMPWWPRRPEWGDAFGPFANRNHISSLAAIATVLCAACAYDAHRRKSRLWSCFALLVIIPVTCIFMNTSRAGVILVFVGGTAWLGALAKGSGYFKKMTVITSLVLIISSLMMVPSGGVSARMLAHGSEALITDQGRTAIYLRTLDMILSAPWLGQGLGNFDAVSPQFSEVYNQRDRPIHPESDLLWLLAEGGILTLLPCFGVLAWIYGAVDPWFRSKRRRGPSGSRGDLRLRKAAAIVFGLGVLHGVVDVPFHGLGYFSFLVLLAGIAIRPRRLPLMSVWWSRASHRVAGAAVLLLGVCWIANSQGHLIIPGKSAAENLRVQANQMMASGSFADALQFQNAALANAPMDFSLYFDRAKTRLYLRQQDQNVMEDFSRARKLEPNNTDMCYREGLLWLDFKPEYAIVSWREIMERCAGYYYSSLLNHTVAHPELKQPLWNLATTAELKLGFLSLVTNREEFESCLRSLLAQQPDLEELEPVHRERLFNIWYQLGDQTALISALETNRKWRNDGWRLLAGHYARNSDFQRACQAVAPYLPSVIRTAPGTSSDIPALERALLYNPTDARRGIDLFQAQKNQGDIDGALRTLEKVATIANAPPYIRQEIAALYVMKQDFRRAWEYFREAMEKR